MLLTLTLLAFSCHAVSAGSCPEGFDQNVFGGSCYSFSSSTSQFSGAKSACEALGGALATVESAEEHAYLKTKITGSHYVSGERKTTGIYYNNGDQVTYGWNGGEPNNVASNEKCVEMRDDFSWKINDVPCDTRRISYICETAQSPCPEGFIVGQKGCLFFHTADDKTWFEADAACRAVGAKLISFGGDRQRKQDYVKAYIAASAPGLSYWTSGTRTTFLWGTGRPLTDDDSLWDDGEPNNQGGESCVEMRDVVNYDLNDIACTASKKYICEIRAPCPSGYSFVSGVCGCYKTPVSGSYSQTGAEAFCQQSNGNLVSYETDEEFNAVRGFLTAEGSSSAVYWTSATRQNAEFYFISGGHLASSFGGWGSGEPNDAGGSEDCVEFRVSNSFKLNDMPCTYSLVPICESLLDESSTGCDLEHRSTRSCYKFGTSGMNWDAAKAHCESTGSHLVDLDSIEEYNVINAHLTSSGATLSHWTGGHRTDFIWGSEVPLLGSHAAWHSGEPNDSGSTEDCVEIRSDGLLNDLTCSRTRSAFCEARGKC